MANQIKRVMNELTIEQKAQRYDEAYKVAENIHRFSSNIAEIKRMEDIFHELKEENEDEKIRKALINFLKSPFVNENITDEKVTPWITWLEKQGEQKPVIEMKSAEERALKAYPKMSRISEHHGVIPADNKSHYLGDANAEKREGFIEGYHQAEKDLEIAKKT